ncbi:hypothetical protein BCR44DRAFT_1044614 [Catenaria anguillulae PL171]|uniref:Uncharacterized protein n=1 Tax=Catenaria anguillulae PL171 TaxID=765915 RepID=A0A1Y2HS05_9FUNG|nr:hypothetical protein BCR44DRAFT_1044614 [Catenaria anguillulae PL171]
MQMCKEYSLELEPYPGFLRRSAICLDRILVHFDRRCGKVGPVHGQWRQGAQWGQGDSRVGHDCQVHNSQSFEEDSKPGMLRTLGYGLGLDIFEYNNQPCWAHVGGMPGVLNRLVLLPATKTSIFIATNCTIGITYLLTNWLLSILAPSPDPSVAPFTVERAHKSLPNWKYWYLWDGASQYKELVGATWPPTVQPLQSQGGSGCDALDLAGTYFNPALDTQRFLRMLTRANCAWYVPGAKMTRCTA